jgi:hypothetical protein
MLNEEEQSFSRGGAEARGRRVRGYLLRVIGGEGEGEGEGDEHRTLNIEHRSEEEEVKS